MSFYDTHKVQMVISTTNFHRGYY